MTADLVEGWLDPSDLMGMGELHRTSNCDRIASGGTAQQQLNKKERGRTRMANRLRSGLVAGFGAAAVLLALSSTAYACTWFNGSVLATPSGTGSAASMAQGGIFGNPGHADMGYCKAWGTTGDQIVGTFNTNNGTTAQTVTFTGNNLLGSGAGTGNASCSNNQGTITTYACPWQVDSVTGHDCANANQSLQESWRVNWLAGQWESTYGHLSGQDCMNSAGTSVATSIPSYGSGTTLNMSQSSYTNGYFSYTSPAFTPALGTISVCLTNAETYNDIPQVTYSSI